jgi:hypothetical protein
MGFDMWVPYSGDQIYEVVIGVRVVGYNSVDYLDLEIPLIPCSSDGSDGSDGSDASPTPTPTSTPWTTLCDGCKSVEVTTDTCFDEAAIGVYGEKEQDSDIYWKMDGSGYHFRYFGASSESEASSPWQFYEPGTWTGDSFDSVSSDQSDCFAYSPDHPQNKLVGCWWNCFDHIEGDIPCLCPSSYAIGVTSGPKFVIDGETAPELYLAKGESYTFTNINGGGHKFRISNTAEQGGSQQNTIDNGTLFWSPQTTATFYYWCDIPHTSMGNKIHVVDNCDC